MKTDRRSLICSSLALATTAMGRTVGAQTPPPRSGKALPAGLPEPTETIDLWPAGAPGMPLAPPTETVLERSAEALISDRAVFGITRPRMVVFRPDRPNGAAVLLFPGGGYRHIVVDKEGYEMAHWLVARGITAFVLFYRLPGEGWASGPEVILADAQRALRLIRHHATRFELDAERVASMGFSAGGHMGATLATRFAARGYDKVDAADALSARPFCAASIYPVVSMRADLAHAGSRSQLIGADASVALAAAHSPDQHVPLDAPPHFLVHAEDDASVAVANTLLLRDALKARGIAVETHLFHEGGHGFGLHKAAGKPVAAWPVLWLTWATSLGLN
jgi:acetyl esterase/lipase